MRQRWAVWALIVGVGAASAACGGSTQTDSGAGGAAGTGGVTPGGTGGGTAGMAGAGGVAGSAGTGGSGGTAGTAGTGGDEGYCPLPKVPSANGWLKTPTGQALPAMASVFGLFGGECGGLQVALADDPSTLATFIEQSTISGWAKVENVFVLMVDTGKLSPGQSYATNISIPSQPGLSASGTLTVNDYVPPDNMQSPGNTPWLSISFTVDTVGWSGGGSADASYCTGINIYCP